jgi:hypothetical protein
MLFDYFQSFSVTKQIFQIQSKFLFEEESS